MDAPDSAAPDRPLPLGHRAPDNRSAVGQVILKVAQRCNLNCTYCYVYNRGDDSWSRRPPVISDRVVEQLAHRINEHCAAYGLSGFTIEIHGGEPLLIGRKRMRRVVEILETMCEGTIRFEMQTNGLLLDEEWLDLLSEKGINFGISIDGPPAIADRRRILRLDGSGSTQRILDTIARLRAAGPAFDELFGGALCVVNPELHGGELVDWFVDHGFDSFDFLLPDGNRVNLPQDWTGPEPYRRFLLEAFDRWYEMGEDAPHVRKFELMLGALMGGRVQLDSLGGDLRLLCVIESDGSIGVSDVARICGGPYSEDQVNIFDHPLDQHIPTYRIEEIQQLCDTCTTCPHAASCGGGYLPHRFDGVGFANPSIYCDALYALSERMTTVLRRDLPGSLWAPVTMADPVGVVIA
jgi:uncharacterized protein